jgi:branched-chain amino acid transport system permease protein
MEILLQQIINGLVLGSMYALVALGYTMVYGIINLINFAHGEVLMVGALTSWTIIGLMKDAMPGTPGWVVTPACWIWAMWPFLRWVPTCTACWRRRT